MRRKELREMEPVKKDSLTRSIWRIYEQIPMNGTERWTVHQKYGVAMTFVTCGSVRKTEKKTGIPRTTIRQWMRSDWWPVVCEMCAELQSHKFQGRLYAVMDKALEALEERIEEGDVIMTRTGKESLPVKAKDLMSIAASAAATRAKVKEFTPSVDETTTPTSKKLLDLSMALALVARRAQEQNNPKTDKEPIDAVDAEIIEDNGN